MFAGVEIAKMVFHRFDPDLQVEVAIKDGTPVNPGDVAFTVRGRVRSMLQTERLVLNIMQRMSGIATTTREYVKLLQGTSAKVLDTRKTTPGMRLLEKQAVKLGGGENHRIGLFDMILLKDNHVDFAGGIESALRGAQRYLKEKNKTLKVEIEVRNLAELEEALQVGIADRIMLDNFSVETTREAVKRVAGRVELSHRGHHARYHPRVRRNGCRFHIGRCAHALRQEPRYEPESHLITLDNSRSISDEVYKR